VFVRISMLRLGLITRMFLLDSDIQYNAARFSARLSQRINIITFRNYNFTIYFWEE
jgi:hypothetical protein